MKTILDMNIGCKRLKRSKQYQFIHLYVSLQSRFYNIFAFLSMSSQNFVRPPGWWPFLTMELEVEAASIAHGQTSLTVLPPQTRGLSAAVSAGGADSHSRGAADKT